MENLAYSPRADVRIFCSAKPVPMPSTPHRACCSPSTSPRFLTGSVRADICCQHSATTPSVSRNTAYSSRNSQAAAGPVSPSASAADRISISPRLTSPTRAMCFDCTRTLCRYAPPSTCPIRKATEPTVAASPASAAECAVISINAAITVSVCMNE